MKKTLRPPKTDGNGTSKSAVDPTKFAHISGKVVMAGTDEPIPTTLYIAHNAQYESLDRAGKTDADGSFRIERRPRALQSLCAVPVDRMWYPAEGLVKVDLREGPVEDLVLTAAPGVAISGKALDGEGSPVAENWVMLQSKATPRLDELTDIDGRFSFGNLPPLDQPVTLTFGTVKAEVGPLEAGETVDDVVLQLPAPSEKFTIHGDVVDERGEPVAGVHLTLQKGLLGNPNHGFASGNADGHGRFAVTFNENTLPGPIKTQVYAPMQFKVGSLDQRTGRECTILEGGTLDNAAKEDAPEMHLVVQVPPMRLLGGYVENTEGQPLQPQIQVRYDRYKSDRVECDKRGSFLTYRLPEEPFLLEFTLEDHQAVVLEQDRDFDINDRSIHVVMKEGPYPDDVSVWTAVTGKPDTEEAIGKTVQGENIKRREEEYRRLASASAEREEQQRRAAGQPQPPPEPKAPSELEIMAVDTKGKPVPRIVVQRASALETYSSPLQLRRDNAVPARNAPKEVLTNDDGVYTVPNFSIVEANGVGRELVLIQKGEAYEEPMRVTLAPAASITVRVTDYDGKPQKDLVVVPAEDMWAMEGTDFYGAPRTTAKGEVRLDPLFPGDYTLAVRQPRQFKDGQAVKANLKPAYAFAHVDAGEHVTCEVIFGTPKPGSADAILDNWIAALKNRNKKPEDFPPESRSQRRAVAKLIVQRINATNQVLPQLRDEIRGMALVARALNDKDTVQPFKALLLRADKNAAWEWWFGGWPSEAVNTIVDVAGNDCIEFLEVLAQKSSVAPKIRAQAVIGLGRLGTPESVAAFVRLRDAAFEKPNAPERKDSYTHAEKMAEAVTMTLFVIPDSPQALPVQPNSARVDLDYETGGITVGNALSSGATTFRMRRFGSEWLVVEILSSVIV